MAIEKDFTAYLMVNWRTGDIKLFKRPQDEVTGYWVPIHLRIKMVVPEYDPELSVRVELSETTLTHVVATEMGLLPDGKGPHG